MFGLAGGRLRRCHMAVVRRVVPRGQVLATHAQCPAQKGE